MRMLIDVSVTHLGGPEHGEQPDWLTITEAAEILGVDKSTVRRWDGRLQPVRTPGGQRRYRRADVLNAYQQGGAA
jgi:excisionase family DNA binding protein